MPPKCVACSSLKLSFLRDVTLEALFLCLNIFVVKVCVCCSNITPICDAVESELWDDDFMRPPDTRVGDCECLSTGLLLGVVLCGSSEIKLGSDEDEAKASPAAPST